MLRAKRERGQVLVIFAGGLVLLLAIAALVFDIGFVLMLRRQEQNAVDPGAIAAARYIKPTPSTSSMQAAACWYARQNGFFESATTNTGCIPANDSSGATLTVNYPPSAAAGTYVGRPGFVEVVVARTHPSFFAQVLGFGQFRVTTSAVAADTSGNSNSNSLVALDPSGTCGTGNVSGGAAVSITPATDPGSGLPYDGGYVYVNSSCGGAPDNVCSNSGQGALAINGSGSNLTAPKVYTRGTCVKANNNSFNAPLVEGAVQIGDPLADLPEPQFGPPGAFCGDPAAIPVPPQTNQTTSTGCNFNNNGATYNLKPGVYYGGWTINGNNVTLHLDAGIYIIAGGGIKLGASGTISSVASGTSTPAPVMIFSTDNPVYQSSCYAGTGNNSQCQGGITFTAGSDLLLEGMSSGPYKGILLWQDGTASGATNGPNQKVDLAGQGALTLSGTIYAPRGKVTLDGGASGTGYAAVQIIAWQFTVTGNAALSMP